MRIVPEVHVPQSTPSSLHSMGFVYIIDGFFHLKKEELNTQILNTKNNDNTQNIDNQKLSASVATCVYQQKSPDVEAIIKYIKTVAIKNDNRYSAHFFIWRCG